MVGEFFHYELLRQAPTHEKAEHNTAQGHNPHGRDIVEGIEETAAGKGTEVGQRTETERAKGAEDRRGHRHIGGRTPSRHAIAVDEEGRHLLVH